MCKLLDLLGRRYGTRTVVDRAENTRSGRATWVVRCDCGREDILNSTDIQRCNACRACGHAKLVRHGHARKTRGYPTGEYRVWVNMRSRCLNPSNPGYKNYGGRGITICNRWLESFDNFLEDMGPRPAGHSLDRIDNNGNYCPENCRWATTRQQGCNKRTVRNITIGSETKPISHWAAECPVSAHQIGQRLNAGLDGEEAVRAARGVRLRGRRPHGAM